VICRQPQAIVTGPSPDCRNAGLRVPGQGIGPGTLALGGLVDDVQAAGAQRVRQWIQELSAAAQRLRVLRDRAQVLSDDARRLAPGFFGLLPDPWSIEVAEIEAKRAESVKVLDWLYDFESTYLTTGVLAAIPIGTVAIITGGALAAFIAAIVVYVQLKDRQLTAGSAALGAAAAEQNPEIRAALIERAAALTAAGAGNPQGGGVIDRVTSWIGRNTVVAAAGVGVVLFLPRILKRARR